MNKLLTTYRAVAVVDAGPLAADRRHPLVLAGMHVLQLRREGGGVVDSFPYAPARRPATLKRALAAIDDYGRRGFSWVADA